jgi:site-specific DNA-methyltransferase (adenine-specific)
MPENTDHPTQKPEKLLAKIILASSDEKDMVFDPFAGSGTTLVTSKKLNRNYCGVEIDSKYAALCAKRLELAERDISIQGFEDGIFWERNSIRKK